MFTDFRNTYFSKVLDFLQWKYEADVPAFSGLVYKGPAPIIFNLSLVVDDILSLVAKKVFSTKGASKKILEF